MHLCTPSRLHLEDKTTLVAALTATTAAAATAPTVVSEAFPKAEVKSDRVIKNSEAETTTNLVWVVLCGCRESWIFYAVLLRINMMDGLGHKISYLQFMCVCVCEP